MANLDAQSLLTDARCLACNGGLSEAEALKLQLLATIVANGGVSPVTPCVPPHAPAGLSVSAFTATTITLQISLSITDPIPSSYVIKWGTTLGGPYPNSKSTNNSGFQDITTADGLVVGTTYYFVAYAFTGCISTSSSPEASGALTSSSVTAWAARVVANGGALPSNNTQMAFSTLINTLTGAGLWNKMIMFNGMAPDSVIAARTPLLLGTGGTDPWAVVTTAPTVSVAGLQGSATGSMNSGLIPANIFANDTSASIGAYVSVANNVGSQAEIGVYNPGNNNSFIFATVASATTGNFDCFDVSAGRKTFTAPSPATGLFIGTRIAANDSRVFFGNSLVPMAQVGTTLATTAGTRTNLAHELAIFAYYNGTGNTDQCRRTVSCLFVGLGFTGAECTTLFNAIQAMRTSLGGGYI